MATVYLADDLRHERKVALKVLKPELAAVVGAERFLAEIKTTANLQHPHILPLFDSGEADGFLYYVMPYVEGESLRDRIDREKQLPVDEAVRIATAVANALDHAHRHKVIHRDIKPANILLQDGEPVVADFGIALAIGAAGSNRLTETGLSLGTPFYMSPEQATGDQPVGAATDTYALGSVLYEMLTGDPPYMGSTAQAVLGQIISAKPISATEKRPAIPANVDAALRCALEKLPADRFTSAQDFVRALGDEHFRYGEVAAGVAGTVASPWNRLTMAFAALAAVATLGFGWALLRTEAPQPVLRYSMAFSAEEALTTNVGSRIAVSPDGSRIVYMGSDEQQRLWLRNRDQLHATPLPGTDGGTRMFFSRDGSRVGFVAQRIWRIASLGGGPPITFADDTDLGTTGGSWGVDGYLYFDGNLPGNGLARVPESGGPAEAVTMIDTTRGEEAHLWPEALPGGRGVVFSVRPVAGRANFTDWDIAVADLTTGTDTVLMRGVRAVYAESGHLVYVTADGTLMAVPFDEKALTLTGNAVALVEGVRLGVDGMADLAISTTGTLFYATGGLGRGGLAEVVWVTRDGTAEEIDPGWTGDFTNPKLSPDGKQLAVEILANDETQIWIKQLDQGPLSKLTFVGASNGRPAWTPDGRSVAFVSLRGNNADLYVRRADGSAEAELLLDEEGNVPQVAYSPDGEWLVYRVGTGGTSRDLYGRHMGSDTAIALVVTEYAEQGPALSLNGRWLAYTSNESGQNEVYVRPFPNTNDGKWQVSTDGGSEPVWAHSGRELFYKGSGNLMVVEVLQGATFVTGQRRVLFSIAGFRSAAVHQFYDVTPDDQRFVMIRNQGVREAGELIVVENFFEELKRLVPN